MIKAKPPLRDFFLCVDVYSFTIRVLLSTDVDRIVKLVNKHFGYPDDKEAGYRIKDFSDITGKFMWKDGCRPIVWLPSAPSTPEEYGTLVHELEHATSYIGRWTGLEHSRSSEEAFCYLIGYLTSEFLKKCK